MLLALTGYQAEAQVLADPDKPFKLATFATGGADRVGILIDDRLFDIQDANDYLVSEAAVADVNLPNDMKTLIEQMDMTKPRLFQIANYLWDRTNEVDFGYDPDDVSIRAPIRYPWNLLAAGQNYRAHAAEMGGSTDIDPEEDDPFLFAKSPRSSIVDPGQPYAIPAGRTTIDWEGEFVIVIGREAKGLTLDNAMDYVFGFTIMFDISDRAAQIPVDGRYARDWFAGKSMDNSAPMGPYIVPLEFLPNYGNVTVQTRVNGELMQNSDTSYMIHNVERILRYATAIMTFWPGDVIATGTPSGVGNGRDPQIFLSSGDVVEIEIEGIGTLVTPIK